MMKKGARIYGGLTASLIISFGLFASLRATEATATASATARGPYDAQPAGYADKSAVPAKLSAALRAILARAEGQGLDTPGFSGPGVSALTNRLVRVSESGAVQVYLYVTASSAREIATLEALDAEIQLENHELGIIQASVPLAGIREIAALPFIRRIAPPGYGFTRAGGTVTEGDAILKADALRNLGFDGSGVKVGVISDGVDHRLLAQLTGDLPSAITIQTYSGGGDEGTAMLEIVHDIAPGADLGFCGPRTSLEMVVCVDELVREFGASILVDDIGFFDEPFFQDGPIAQAVANAVASGVVYASAAGNQAGGHYQGNYLDSGDVFHSHDFAGGVTTIPIHGPPGDAIVLLQWTNPFGGAVDDYDLCLTDASGTTQSMCADDVQPESPDPVELLDLPCSHPSGCSGFIQIEKRSGSPQTLGLYFFKTTPSQFVVSDQSIFGHPCVDGVVATAAIAANDPGNADIESFSSRGPCTIRFPSLEVRPKPDVTAIDGVTVTGAGGFPSPFFGTSAAAPHVAGVAALLKGGGFSGGSAAGIAQALKNSAVDLGPTGEDSTYGAGRIDAFAAAQLLNDPPDGAIDTPSGSLRIKKGGAVDFGGSCTDSNSVTGMSVLWSFGAGSDVPDSTEQNPGRVAFPNAGTFEVTMTCRDGLGKEDPSPAARTITVANPGRGGGGCSIEDAGAGELPGGLLATLLGLLVITTGWKLDLRLRSHRSSSRLRAKISSR